MAEPLNLSLQQIAAWLDGARVVGDAAMRIARVHTDSRSLQAGDLFVALRGERFDAHDFLQQAKADGATAALAERGLADAALPGIEVPDSRIALGQLARGWRQQFTLPLIAVTGSNGKTTVTQMVASILRAAAGDAAHFTQGNLNNDIGVPQTLLRLRATHRLSVVELGMNHPGEIAWLADLARPTVALVNNAQREHQEFMGTVEAVAHENAAVFAALPADGVAVFPADDVYTELWTRLAQGRRCLRFAAQVDSDVPTGAAVHTSDAAAQPKHDMPRDQHGATATTAPPADLYLRDAQWQGDHWQLRAVTPAGELATTLHVAGRHNLANALAASACALAAGVPLDAVARGLADFRPVQGRSRALQLRLGERLLTLVDDSYNANPDSVRAAIDVLAELPGPRLLVLGDMGEVGEQGPEFHREVGLHAQARGIEQVLCLGELARHTAEACANAEHCADIDALQARVQALLPQVGSVLVKGSRFMKMERVVQAVMACAEQQKQGAHACC